jgi:hypothetical protein
LLRPYTDITLYVVLQEITLFINTIPSIIFPVHTHTLILLIISHRFAVSIYYSFFVLQAWLMIAYFFFFILVGAFKGQPTGLYAGEQGITTGYQSILVLISVYIYLTTWTYIPAAEHKSNKYAYDDMHTNRTCPYTIAVG